jgi:hypothetical protein
MRKLLAAAAVLTAASLTTFAFAQVKPLDQDGTYIGAVTAQQQMPASPNAGIPAELAAPDAQSLASTQEVGEARRYYRSQCNRYENAGFCDCVTAGVAQALLPAEVRMAGRTIGERLTAQGDAAIATESDNTMGAESSAERIEMIEGHYADACAQFRG